MSTPLTFDYRHGILIAFWRGERIGHFDYVSGGVVDGCAIYGDQVFSTSDFTEYGIPLEWVERGVTLMCVHVDAERAAA